MAFRAFVPGNDRQATTTATISFAVPAAPTVQVGDIATVVLSVNSSGSVWTVPSGWTLRGTANPDPNGSNNWGTVILSRTLASGDLGTTISFTAPITARAIGAMMINSGDTESGIIVGLDAKGSPSNTDVPFPTVTTDNSAVAWDIIAVAGLRRTATPAPDMSTGIPSGWTNDGQAQTAFGGSPEFSLYGLHLTAGGVANTDYGTGVSGTSTSNETSQVYLIAYPTVSSSILGGVTDSSTSTDTVSVQASRVRTQADTSTSVDVATVTKTVLTAQADTGTSADAIQVARVLTSGDTSASTDAHSVVQSLARTVSDFSLSTDGVTVDLGRGDILDKEFVIPVVPWVPFGHTQTIDVKSFDPGVYTVQSQDENSTVGDYTLFGMDLHSPPLFAWQLYTNVFDESEALGWADLLKQVWDNAVRRTPGGVLPLRYRINGVVRRVYGRPRRFGINVDKLHLGKVYITCDFQLVEDAYYEDSEQSVTVPITPDPNIGGAGIILPQPLPWHFTTPPTPRTGQAVIAGSHRTWVTIKIHGPVVNPTVQIGGNTYGLLGSVPLGMTAKLDGRPWDGGVKFSDGTYHSDMLDPRAMLSDLHLDPAWYGVIYTGFDNTGTSTCDVSWTTAYKSL